MGDPVAASLAAYQIRALTSPISALRAVTGPHRHERALPLL